MNLGSSRSHAALILTLHQEIDGMYQKTKFHLVDLAGAERPDKTGGQRMSALEAFINLASGKKVDPGVQGTIINYSLSELATSIRVATDANAKGKTY
jgi:hypothetical protein